MINFNLGLDAEFKELPTVTYGTGVLNSNGVGFYIRKNEEPEHERSISAYMEKVEEARMIERMTVVEERAHALYRQFLAQYQIAPNVFFMSRSDYYALTKHSHNLTRETETSTMKFMGLEVKHTELDRSYVALIPKEF